MPTLKIIKTPDGWVVSGFPKESEISVIGFWAKAYFYPGTSPTIYWNLPPANSGFALELKEKVEQMCAFLLEFTSVVNEFRNLSYRICRNKKREGSSLNEAVSYMNERAINPPSFCQVQAPYEQAIQQLEKDGF